MRLQKLFRCDQLRARQFVWAATLQAVAVFVGTAHAQSATSTTDAWPTKQITLIVPFGPGTATDVIARAIAGPMAKALKVAVIVDNRAGASASIGAAAVARAAPDGYTILVGSSTTHAANAALFKQLSYDPVANFSPITLLGSIPQVMVVNPAMQAKTVAEFVSHAQANSGKVTYAQGSSGNLLPASILDKRKMLGLAMVPYKSPPSALVDVMGGQVDMMFADMSVSLSNIRAGKLRALAVTSAVAAPQLPGVPPLADTLPGFELTSWIAMWAPAGTPTDRIDRVRRAAHGALADKAIVEQLVGSGFRIQLSSPDELGLLVAKETIKWAKFANEAGAERQ